MSIFKRGGVPDGVHKDRFSLPLSSLTNISAYGDAHWMDLYRELGTYSYDDHIFRSLAPPDVYRGLGVDANHLGPRAAGNVAAVL
jgi:hypothetical protein